MTTLNLIPNPHLAAVDLTLIIWIIVGIFWFIAQLVNKVKENQQPPPAERPSRPSRSQPQPVTRRAVEDELKDFLESLTGVEPEKPRHREAPRTERESDEEDLHPAYQDLEDRYDREAPKPPTPARPAPPPVPVVPTAESQAYAYEAISTNAYDQLGEIEDIKEMEEMAWGAEAGTTFRLMRSQNLSINLAPIQIPTVRIPLTFLTRAESIAHAPRLHDIKAIRKSIVAHTLLAPPKALRDDLNEMHKP